MKSKQIIGIILTLLGGIGEIVLALAVSSAFKSNKFWGGGWHVVSFPTTEIIIMVALGALLFWGISMIKAGD
jgi:hypothetical protein